MSVKDYWFLWGCLEFIFGNISGKQVTCIMIVGDKREEFPFHASHDVPFRLRWLHGAIKGHGRRYSYQGFAVIPYSRSSSSSLSSIPCRQGRWGTTDDFTTSFLYCSLFSTALWDVPNSRPVHSLMLSSHLFLCLPCLLPPFTVPRKMVSARPDERETRPYHCRLRLFMIVRTANMVFVGDGK